MEDEAGETFLEWRGGSCRRLMMMMVFLWLDIMKIEQRIPAFLYP